MAKCHRPMTYWHNFSLFKYKTCKYTIKNSEHSVIQRVLNVSTFQEMLHFEILRDLLCCNNFSSPILEVQITYPSLRDTFSYLPRVLLHQRFS